MIVVNYFFLKGVSAGFARFYHFDNAGELFALSGFQRSNYFLCHVVLVLRLPPLLLDFFVNGHTLEDRVVFFQLDTVRRVLLVLRSDVPRSTRLTAFFVFGAFQDHLDAAAFLSHCLIRF